MTATRDGYSHPSSDSGESSDSSKYELVPPEGGWGYMVCLGLSIIFVSYFKFASRFH